MAYKPSARRKSTNANIELNMLPVMNLMVVLIPLLLSASEFVKLGVISLDLPTGTEGGGETTPPDETKRTLDMIVLITKDGFAIDKTGTFVKGLDGSNLAVSKKDGAYDYAGLSARLRQIKDEAEAENVYSDLDQARVTADADTQYDTVISTMDAIRVMQDAEGRFVPIFPRVSLGAILAP